MIPISTVVLFYFAVVCILFLLFRIELTAPAALYCISFLVCLVASYILREEWLLEYLDEKTFSLLIVSTILVIVIDRAVWAYSHSSKVKQFKSFSMINMPLLLIQATIALNLILMVWSMFKSGAITSLGSSLNSVMELYKESISYGAESDMASKVVSQIGKLATALTYIESFILVNNIVCMKKMGRENSSGMKALLAVLVVTFFLFRLFFRGSRQSSIFLLVGVLTMYFICITASSSRKSTNRGRRKAIAIMVTVALVLLVAFYFLGRVVGRKLSDNPLDASVGYLATGILGLNDIVSQGLHSVYWGEKTFVGAADVFQLLGIWPSNMENYSMLPFFRHGNTVTILGRWYWDFGIGGALLILAILILLFSVLYYYFIRSKKNSSARVISIIVYGFLVHIFYFAGYDDYSFNLWTTNYLLQVILIIALYLVVFRRWEMREELLQQRSTRRIFRSRYRMVIDPGATDSVAPSHPDHSGLGRW